MEGQNDNGPSNDNGLSSGAEVLLGLLVVAVVLGLVVLGVVALRPGTLPAQKDPGFLDQVFANRVVIAVARLVLLAGAVYIVLSIGALIYRGWWITGAGPFQAARISESVTEIAQERDELAAELATARQVIEELREDVEAKGEALDEALGYLDMLQVPPELEEEDSSGGEPRSK